MKRMKYYTGVLSAAVLLSLTSLSGMTAFAEETAALGKARWENTTKRNENSDIVIDFEEVQVILPADWGGKCQMGLSEDSVAFYHTASRKNWTEELGYPAGGWLFTVHFSEELDFLDFPSIDILGRVEDGYYYASFPTDVQGYMNDTAILEEYGSMHNDLDWIRANYSITGEELPMDDVLSAEYIFPTSDSAYLTEEDLAGMTKDEVQMAINEIYARHHRKFVMENVQEYFNSKSWYTGTVEAAEFDTSVMNQYEGANINLMVNYMSTME